MFTRGYFPSSYFPPSYWPKTGGKIVPSSIVPRGHGSKVGGLYLQAYLAYMADKKRHQERKARSQVLSKRAVNKSILRGLEKRLEEEKQVKEMAMYSVLLAEL